MYIATNDTLTDIEIRGLSASFSLADGHAYQDTGHHYQSIIDDLSSCWQRATQASVPEMEDNFKNSFATLIGSPTVASLSDFRICPTASNSIDIIGAFLAQSGLRTALIEPTFDNLALLLKRRGASVVSASDDGLMAAARAGSPADVLERLDVAALFLVNPNNPTGRTLEGAELEALLAYCNRTGTKLIMDNSFLAWCHR